MSSYTDRRYYLNVIKGLIDYEDVRLYVRSSPEVRALRRLFRGEAHEIDILDYVHPGTEELKNTLMREIGWTPTSEELEHGDCVLNPLKDYLMNRKWGYSETTQAYSCLVRIGELSRDEALRIAEHEEVRTEPDIVPEFLAKIGVTRDRFEQSRNRHFTEFPNYTASTSFRVQRKVVRSIRRVISRVRGKASG